MELKVNLPDPYELEAEHFFAQMRIALKVAEKTYQKERNGRLNLLQGFKKALINAFQWIQFIQSPDSSVMLSVRQNGLGKEFLEDMMIDGIGL